MARKAISEFIGLLNQEKLAKGKAQSAREHTRTRKHKVAPAPPPLLHPLEAEWPTKQLRRIVVRDGPTCWLCGNYVHPKETGSYEPSVDHIRPKSEGGGGLIHNLKLAHRFCNNLRQSKTPHEGWERCKAFAHRRDPTYVLYNQAPAQNAEMPPPTRPIPKRAAKALAAEKMNLATADRRSADKRERTKQMMIETRRMLEAGEHVTGKQAAACAFLPYDWPELVEPLPLTLFITCLKIMLRDGIGVSNLHKAYLIADGCCHFCKKEMDIFASGKERVRLVEDKVGHSYCFFELVEKQKSIVAC